MPPIKESKSACLLNLENGKILGRSIERLLKEDTEVLVVDNNSQDCTLEVLKEYRNNPRVKIWRWNTIRGQSENRNLMIKNATGKYILLLDSDILYIPNSFDYLIERLKIAPPEIKCLGFDPWYYTNKEEEADAELPPLNAELSFKGQPIALTQYGVFDRDIFYKYNIWFDENFGVGYGCEDNDLALQMLEKGLKCACVPCKYFHNKHTAHWWVLHTPSFMRYEERSRYFMEKWGYDVFWKYYGEKRILKSHKNGILDLLRNKKSNFLENLPREDREVVLKYLNVLKGYEKKNPQKYLQREKEFVRKILNQIYGNKKVEFGQEPK